MRGDFKILSNFQLVHKHKISKQTSKSLKELDESLQNKRAAMRDNNAKAILAENTQIVASELRVPVEQAVHLLVVAEQVEQLVITLVQATQDADLR